MENAGSIISRNDIICQLWEMEEFVEESTLNVNINRLRKKLSELGLEELLDHKKRNGVYGMKISEYICDKGRP
ncbi:MAG: helix-turn-helix domain-containing protein [[Clostridium] scindens]